MYRPTRLCNEKEVAGSKLKFQYGRFPSQSGYCHISMAEHLVDDVTKLHLSARVIY